MLAQDPKTRKAGTQQARFCDPITKDVFTNASSLVLLRSTGEPKHLPCCAAVEFATCMGEILGSVLLNASPVETLVGAQCLRFIYIHHSRFHAQAMCCSSRRTTSA